jgi:hypothetical protein
MPRDKDSAVATLDAALKARTIEGTLFEKLEGGKVRCFACGHWCVIPDRFDGICRVRFNRGGVLYVPRGYVAGLALDPIEKKPFYHVLPGASALSFGSGYDDCGRNGSCRASGCSDRIGTDVHRARGCGSVRCRAWP